MQVELAVGNHPLTEIARCLGAPPQEIVHWGRVGVKAAYLAPPGAPPEAPPAVAESLAELAPEVLTRPALAALSLPAEALLPPHHR